MTKIFFFSFYLLHLLLLRRPILKAMTLNLLLVMDHQLRHRLLLHLTNPTLVVILQKLQLDTNPMELLDTNPLLDRINNPLRFPLTKLVRTLVTNQVLHQVLQAVCSLDINLEVLLISPHLQLYNTLKLHNPDINLVLVLSKLQQHHHILKMDSLYINLLQLPSCTPKMDNLVTNLDLLLLHTNLVPLLLLINLLQLHKHILKAQNLDTNLLRHLTALNRPLHLHTNLPRCQHLDISHNPLSHHTANVPAQSQCHLPFTRKLDLNMNLLKHRVPYLPMLTNQQAMDTTVALHPPMLINQQAMDSTLLHQAMSLDP